MKEERVLMTETAALWEERNMHAMTDAREDAVSLHGVNPPEEEEAILRAGGVILQEETGLNKKVSSLRIKEKRECFWREEKKMILHLRNF